MFTLLTTLFSFLAGGLPKLMDFFQDKSDKSHEIEMAKMQTERELQMLKEGYIAQAKVEEIRTEQIAIQSAEKERESLYAHDIAIGQGASTWVINARAMVRPAVTYGMFILFAFVEIFGFMYAWKTNVDFSVALDVLWDNETQIVWASVVSFWFGTQAFSKK
jgi:D-alanyl-D-alanine carboxypeptidase